MLLYSSIMQVYKTLKITQNLLEKPMKFSNLYQPFKIYISKMYNVDIYIYFKKHHNSGSNILQGNLVV